MKDLIKILSFSILMVISSAHNQSKNEIENKKVIKLNKIYSINKQKYQKAKQVRSLKNNYIDSTLNLAHFFLTSKGFPPKIKYPQALKFYREVLSIDSKNLIALQSKNMIESIYKSMNRPIPK